MVGVNELVKFDAVLHPHTSLGPRAFLLLMAVLGFISFIAGIAFVMIGAWPVFGFIGLDIALVYMAFRINYTGARRYETLKLTESALIVEQYSPQGERQSWRFQPYWLRVEIEEPPQPDSPLTLRSHGEALEIGSFLTPGEKHDLAIALRAEFERLRNPTITG